MDHERVNIRDTSMSCGVMELSRINDDIAGVLYGIGSRLYHPSRGNPCGAFIFSDIKVNAPAETTNSDRLANNVIGLGLGEITVSDPIENPRTGNIIRVYVWIINHEAFKSYYAKARVEKLGRVGS